MKILSIDTSCDDTSVAISENKNILANVFWSKMKLHTKWGGVVPNEAKRQHEEFLEPAINQVLEDSRLKITDIDYFAVTYGPGLAVALEAGIKKAKELAIKYNKPLVAVDHMVGHIYANLAHDEKSSPLSNLDDFEFPLIALTISGGHTELVLMESHLNFKIIGSKIDDALGECIDKVGRILGMPFPAGKYIEEAAEKGNRNICKFPIPMLKSDNFNFSYSGLKTAVLYKVRDHILKAHNIKLDQTIKITNFSSYLDKEDINNFAASFQYSAFEEIVSKVEKALIQYNPKMFIVGGGVIANKTLRLLLEEICKKYNTPLYYPLPFWLCTDNAAMIAIAAYYYITNNVGIYSNSKLDLVDRIPGLKINSAGI